MGPRQFAIQGGRRANLTGSARPENCDNTKYRSASSLAAVAPFFYCSQGIAREAFCYPTFTAQLMDEMV